jgi:hypothetical protein
MTDEKLRTNQNIKYLDHRGGLVYRQEHGYKLITMMVWLRTPDEQSCVVSRVGDLDIIEEADHIPSDSPLISLYPRLEAIDVYHFAVADGTEIELTIKDQSGERQVRYTVQAPGVLEEDSPSFQLDIVRSSESVRDHHIQTSQEHDVPFLLENSLTHLQTTKSIPLNEIDNLVRVSPQFEGSYNVFSGYSKDTLSFTAKGLLSQAEWVTEHKYQLQTEAKANQIQLPLHNPEIDFGR